MGIERQFRLRHTSPSHHPMLGLHSGTRGDGSVTIAGTVMAMGIQLLSALSVGWVLIVVADVD